MRIERVSVRRLKSFWDYSNAAVELTVVVDENDDLDSVVKELMLKAEAYASMAKDLSRSEELKEMIEKLRKNVEIHLKDLEEYKNELIELDRELSKVIQELHGQVESKRSLLEKIKSVVRQ